MFFLVFVPVAVAVRAPVPEVIAAEAGSTALKRLGYSAVRFAFPGNQLTRRTLRIRLDIKSLINFGSTTGPFTIMFTNPARKRLLAATVFVFCVLAAALKFGAASKAENGAETILPLMSAVSIESLLTDPVGVHGSSKFGRGVSAELTGAGRASVVIYLSEQANVSAAYEMKDQDARGWYVYDTLTKQAERTQADLRSFLKARGVEFQSFWAANMIVATVDPPLAEAIAARSDVARIDSNRPAHWIEDPAISDRHEEPDAPATTEWGVNNVNAPAVWAMGFTGQGIVVGDLDTGTRWTHVALKPKYRGWNGTTADHNYNWHDSIHSGGGSCGFDTQAPCDDSGHGTHTAGSMVGDDGAGNQIGVAPGARWIGCRNMDQGNGMPSTYTECFQFAIAPTDLAGNNPNPALRPHVLNNSWTCPASEGCTTGAELETIVNNTQAAGIFVEASAGNSGPGCSSVSDPPATYSAAFSTGAIGISNNLVAFSSRGPSLFYNPNLLKPNISAPGSNVRSSYGDGDTSFTNLSGTSMAGPHVCGVVALLWSARPQLSRDIAATKALLQNSANPNVTISTGPQTCGGISSTQIPNNSFGYGRVDALAAVNAAGPSPTSTNTPTPTVTATFTPTNTPTPGPAPQYQIFDIGVVQAGDTASQGFGVSVGGMAVGRSVRTGASQAFTWTQGGGLVGLPNLPGRAFAVSNATYFNGFAAVGTAANSLFGTARLPVKWENGVVSQLPLPAGETLGDAFDVNASGIAVGSVNSGTLQRGIYYNTGGAGTSVITQTTASGSFFTTAFGINDQNRIVGIGVDPSNAARNVGMVYDIFAPSAIDIGALPGFNGAIAFAISNAGYVVGSSMLNQGSGLPFIWTQDGGMVAIPLADGTSQGSARGVNSAGWVVGQDSSAFSIPFLWNGATTYRLQDLIPIGTGWDLSMNTSSSAMGISDNGVIVGTGVHNGETHAYAMVPVVSSTPTATATNTATSTPTILPSPFPEYDLRISQSVTQFPHVGDQVTYTVTVSNFPSALGGTACPAVSFGYPTGVPYTISSISGTNGYTGDATFKDIRFTGGCVSSSNGTIGTATLTVILVPQSAGTLTSLGDNVIVDPLNEWHEDNENNNTAQTVSTTVTAATPTSTPTETATPSNLRSRADFDGDGKTDLSVFRPAEGNWYLNRSTAGLKGVNFGLNGDVPMPGDYDGDGKTDLAVFRGSPTGAEPDYYVLNSLTNTVSYAYWGLQTDTPLAGDYDGDGKADIVVYRSSNNTFYIIQSSGGTQSLNFGTSGDVPMMMDYEGDGRSNLAVFRPSNGTWYVSKPTGVPAQNFYAISFGLFGDMPVPADYDGDNKDDIAVFRPSTGFWYLLRSLEGFSARNFGLNGDVPVPGDYDGDGKDDIAVYRGGVWYLDRSLVGFGAIQYGVSTDVPIPKRYIP